METSQIGGSGKSGICPKYKEIIIYETDDFLSFCFLHTWLQLGFKLLLDRDCAVISSFNAFLSTRWQELLIHSHQELKFNRSHMKLTSNLRQYKVQILGPPFRISLHDRRLILKSVWFRCITKHSYSPVVQTLYVQITIAKLKMKLISIYLS